MTGLGLIGFVGKLYRAFQQNPVGKKLIIDSVLLIPQGNLKLAKLDL